MTNIQKDDADALFSMVNYVPDSFNEELHSSVTMTCHQFNYLRSVDLSLTILAVTYPYCRLATSEKTRRRLTNQ
jgi:hypothetical protein